MITKIKFELDRSTKNTHVYRASATNKEPPAIKTVYIEKWALPDALTDITLTLSTEET